MPVLTIERELRWFTELCETVLPRRFKVEQAIDHGFVLHPKGRSPGGKPIDLTLLGAVHGNEWGGVGVLNRILYWIATEPVNVNIDLSLAVIVGNPRAALANVRFLDRDLNRSFGRESADSLEEKRADAIESLLKETAFLLDFHQTRETSMFPFFIFPFAKESVHFATEISSDFPIVTHWGKPFSGEGRCTDEFVIRQGGVGITLELGQNGLDIRQVKTGVFAALSAIKAIRNRRDARGKESGRVDFEDSREISNEIYTWAQVVPCDDPDAYVDPGFINFSPLRKGQRIGAIRGKEILSEVEGAILFPKYNDHNPNNRAATACMEFCRVLKRISPQQLPEKV